MSLQRNENSNLSALQQEMEHLAVMNAAREQEARKDKEVTLLLSTVQKMGMIQQSFMQNMLQEFDKLNRNQLNVLNVQEQYTQSVRSDTAELFKKFAQEYIKTAHGHPANNIASTGCVLHFIRRYRISHDSFFPFSVSCLSQRTS